MDRLKTQSRSYSLVRGQSLMYQLCFLKKNYLWRGLGLCFCAWAFSSCGEQGLPSSCGAWASQCYGFSLWLSDSSANSGGVALRHVGSSGPGMKPTSALADRFVTTWPPGKSPAVPARLPLPPTPTPCAVGFWVAYLTVSSEV